MLKTGHCTCIKSQLGDFPGAWYPPIRRLGNEHAVDQYLGAELRMIRDGLSKTVLVAETAIPLRFTAGWISNRSIYSGGPPDNPAGLVVVPISPNKTSGQLASHHPGGAHVSMCDGAVRFLDVATSQETLVQVYSRNHTDAQISYSR